MTITIHHLERTFGPYLAIGDDGHGSITVNEMCGSFSISLSRQDLVLLAQALRSIPEIEAASAPAKQISDECQVAPVEQREQNDWDARMAIAGANVFLAEQDELAGERNWEAEAQEATHVSDVQQAFYQCDEEDGPEYDPDEIDPELACGKRKE